MFGILFRVVVNPADRKAFIDFIEKDVRVAHDCEPGTLRFDLYKDPDPEAENAFFVYEAYRNRAAFDEHKKNEPYRHWVAEIRPRMVDFQKVFETDAECW
nr:antibiotic biosynthesis monooxygenase [Chthoniobacterales bacterium]